MSWNAVHNVTGTAGMRVLGPGVADRKSPPRSIAVPAASPTKILLGYPLAWTNNYAVNTPENLGKLVLSDSDSKSPGTSRWNSISKEDENCNWYPPGMDLKVSIVWNPLQDAGPFRREYSPLLVIKHSAQLASLPVQSEHRAAARRRGRYHPYHLSGHGVLKIGGQIFIHPSERGREKGPMRTSNSERDSG